MTVLIPLSCLKDSTSRPESIMETIPESQLSNEKNPFIREGSLKVRQKYVCF